MTHDGGDGNGGYVTPAEIEAERERMRLLMAFGHAVHERRVAIGLSELDLAERLGLSIDEIEGIEQGDPEAFDPSLLPRLPRALQAELSLHISPGRAMDVTFTGR